MDVHAVPRASVSAVVGTHGDRLKVRLQAPPVDGAANRELVRLFANLLGRPRRAVVLESGAGGRAKTLRILRTGTEDIFVAISRELSSGHP